MRVGEGVCEGVCVCEVCMCETIIVCENVCHISYCVKVIPHQLHSQIFLKKLKNKKSGLGKRAGMKVYTRNLSTVSRNRSAKGLLVSEGERMIKFLLSA